MRSKRLAATGLALAIGTVGAVVGMSPVSAGTTGTCNTSSPAGTYSVTVCITAPAPSVTVTGNETVTATVSTTAGAPGVQQLAFGIDGPNQTNPLLTDFKAPYQFVLPSSDFPDGDHTIYAHALMRDGNLSAETTQADTFNNGVAVTPPLPAGHRAPATGTAPAPGKPLIVGAVGDGAGGEPAEANVVNLIKSWNPNLFLYLGEVYNNGTYTEYKNWYDPSNFFGAFKSITNPVPGNRDYQDQTGGIRAYGYFYYWNNIPHYYSYNVHGWHFISLDANTAYIGTHNANANATAQNAWLQSDLAANTSPCVIVTYHEPRYSIGQEGESQQLQSWWSLFAQHKVTLVLNGQNHDYERWTPMDANGNPDPNGVTEIISSPGGHSSRPPLKTDPRVAYHSTGEEFGALRLALSPTKADFSFVQTTGATKTTLDSGSLRCRGLPPVKPPPPPPGGPTGNGKPLFGRGELASISNHQLYLLGGAVGDALKHVKVKGQASKPMWSHDGNWLAVQVRKTRHGKPVGNPVVWLVNPSGNLIRPLTPATARPSSVSWSPTTNQLAVVVTRHHRDRAEVVDLAGHATSIATAKRIAGLAWSPKGTKLAVSLNRFRHHWTSRLATFPAPNGHRLHGHLVAKSTNSILKVAGWWPDGSGVLAWKDPQGSASIATDGLPLYEFAAKSGHRRLLAKSVLQYQGWLSTSKRLNRVAFIAGGDRRLTAGHKHAVVCTTKRCHAVPQRRKQVTFDPAYSAAGRLAVVRDRAVKPRQGFGTAFAAAVANSGTIGVVNKHGVVSVKGAGAGATQPVWGRDGSLMFVRHGSLWLLIHGKTKAVRVFGPLQLPTDYFGFVPWLASFAWSNAV